MSSSSTIGQAVCLGIFADVAAADRAVDAVLRLGLSADHVTVLYSEDWRNGQLGSAVAPLAPQLGEWQPVVGTMACGGVGLFAAGAGSRWAGGIVAGLAGALQGRGVDKQVAVAADQAVADGKILIVVEDRSVARDQTLADAGNALAEVGGEVLTPGSR
ncbi:MAG TPA: hypothetical protein VGJ26_18155 [Pirellulales bacterium]|jgi:hypothetical protein